MRIAGPVLVDDEPKEHELRESDIQWNRIVEMNWVPYSNLLRLKLRWIT